MKQIISPKLFNKIAQNAHILCGSTLTFGTIALTKPHYLWYTLPIFTVVTALKEFYYDYKHESKVVRGSSLEDFLMYNLGSYAALLLYWIKGVL